MWEPAPLAKSASCWPAEFRHQNQSYLTAPHVGFMCLGIEAPVLSIRFCSHPERGKKELPSAFSGPNFPLRVFKDLLLFSIATNCRVLYGRRGRRRRRTFPAVQRAPESRSSAK